MMGCEIQARLYLERGERERRRVGKRQIETEREIRGGGGEKEVTEKTEIYSIWKGADTLISNIGPQSI